MERYLKETRMINYSDESIQNLIKNRGWKELDTYECLKSIYDFVRDEIKHSWDVQDKRVTVSASDVLREGVGICWAKSNLFAALLRANGVPCGFSHQRLIISRDRWRR